jgi:heterodisulfide reductase subunit A
VTTVKSGGRIAEIKHGATIIATGADEFKPVEYLYGKDARVMTQLELEERIAAKEKSVMNAQSLVMIQCVGCRQEDRNYCARICCSHSIKNALKLKEINPQMDIHVLFRDMRPYGFREDYYREAADKDVKFIRYEPEDKPKVEPVEENGRSILKVVVTDPVLGAELGIDADAVALAAAIIPSAGSKEIAALFKVTLNPDGFFQEAHVKLRPVDFGAEGVYLCGIAHYPKHISEAVSQAYGAAGRALTLLSHDTVTASGSVCEVEEDKCVSCGACISACTYGAIEFCETPQGRKARVNPVLCKGDGLCNTKCPTGAIVLKHYVDEAILDQIDAAVPDEFVA